MIVANRSVPKPKQEKSHSVPLDTTAVDIGAAQERNKLLQRRLRVLALITLVALVVRNPYLPHAQDVGRASFPRGSLRGVVTLALTAQAEASPAPGVQLTLTAAASSAPVSTVSNGATILFPDFGERSP
jgi:hypothetical protein